MLTARTALVLTVLLTLALSCDATPSSPVECCYDYRNSPLPLARLKGFYRTSSDCFEPAIVFEARNGTIICANPETKWVKRAVEYLEKKKGLHAL